MNKPTVAYLDISPRLTGKTERLITQAKSLLEAGRRVCFVTSKGLVEDTKLRLPGALILEDGEPSSIDSDTDDAVWFYDEFEWLNSAAIRPGAYYATTPKFIREAGVNSPGGDLLLSLIEAHGGYYYRHTWAFDMAETLQEARAILSADEFRLFYLAEFLI